MKAFNETPEAALTLQEMERAFMQRDASFDGLFYVAVRTTGIFCRPTCPARKPLLKNVHYFFAANDAVAAGYRPCKRCRPTLAFNCPVWAQALLAEVAANPTLDLSETQLQARGINPTTVRRFFKKQFHCTFHTYTRKRRLMWALQQLRTGEALDAVVFDSGYGSHSGFRSAFVRMFGSSHGCNAGIIRSCESSNV
jgi:AraC family transcriptional regulator, regulatory protein of adaptative response / methylated-DNA-[protein]-cysteine methyltransferase